MKENTLTITHIFEPFALGVAMGLLDITHTFHYIPLDFDYEIAEYNNDKNVRLELNFGAIRKIGGFGTNAITFLINAVNQRFAEEYTTKKSIEELIQKVRCVPDKVNSAAICGETASFRKACDLAISELQKHI